MVPVRNDVNPEVVITWHGSGIRDVSTEPVLSEVEGLDMTKRGRMTANCHCALPSPHRLSCRLTLRESWMRDIGGWPYLHRKIHRSIRAKK